jgi:flagellar motility protein MotE (MotC chaperone)
MKQNDMISVARAIVLASILFFCLPTLAGAGNKPVTASPEEVKFSVSLQKREQAVAEKEKKLKQQQEQLVILKKDIDEKLAKISTLQKDIAEKLAELKQVQDAEFKNLIKVFSTMSASKVAPLLNEMDDRNVARILRAMKNDLVAKIIPKLEPRKAVRVSRILGRIDETP